MNYFLKSPPCVLWWTRFLGEPDRKYPHKSGLGYYSVTGSFDQENKHIFNDMIIQELGKKVAGSIAYKSDGTGRTEVKFKCLEEIQSKNGDITNQKPVVIDGNGNQYEGEIETATAHIYFQPKYFANYQKTSLLLKKVEIIAPPNKEDSPKDELIINSINTNAA